MATEKHYHLFELHLDGEGIQFGPKSIGGRDDTESGEDGAEEPESAESASAGSESSGTASSRGKLGLALLLGLGLVAAAVGLKRAVTSETSVETGEAPSESGDIEVREEHEAVEA